MKISLFLYIRGTEYLQNSASFPLLHNYCFKSKVTTWWFGFPPAHAKQKHKPFHSSPGFLWGTQIRLTVAVYKITVHWWKAKGQVIESMCGQDTNPSPMNLFLFT